MQSYGYPVATRSELIEFLPSYYNTVLEVGCGTGGFKQSLKADIELWGIEPNEEASSLSILKGYKVITGLYDDVEDKVPDKYFDLIICNDVIEHMVDHVAFLNKIKSKLKDGGFIIGSIPNVRNHMVLYDLLFNKDWQYQEYGVLDRTHLRFFTEKSLKRVFDDCDYQIEKFSGINSSVRYSFTVKSLIKYTLLNFCFGFFNDTQYIQFAFTIKPRIK